MRRLGPLESGLAHGVRELLSRYGLKLVVVATDASIPGSYWGAPEAGLLARRLFVREDTPLHSILHEACHFICMDDARRAGLDTDAGGDHLEECAVCYLSVLLADGVPGYGRDAMLADMDAWGYSYRLGSARSWFEGDAADALEWLRRHGLVTAGEVPVAILRAA